MEHLDKIAPALMAAQVELANPAKTETAQAGKKVYRYAVLADILDQIKPVLFKHKLCLSQPVRYDGAICQLVTILLHESGQTIESTYPLPKDAPSQDMGSAMTYARRYALCSLLGIAADDDDDGKKHQDNSGVTDVSRDALIELMGNSSIGNKALMDYCRANNLGDGRTTEDLSVEAVKKLVIEWAAVVAAIKTAPTAKLPPNAKPVDEPAKEEPKAAGAGSIIDTEGMNPDVAAMMIKDNVTKQQLEDYYTGRIKGATAVFPPEKGIKPEKLPSKYIEKLIIPANWDTVVKRIKSA